MSVCNVDWRSNLALRVCNHGALRLRRRVRREYRFEYEFTGIVNFLLGLDATLSGMQGSIWHVFRRIETASIRLSPWQQKTVIMPEVRAVPRMKSRFTSLRRRSEYHLNLECT